MSPEASVSSTYPDDGTDAETLLKHADFAMYHAKESGRNNRQFFKHDMNARAARAAVARERPAARHWSGTSSMLHYQPKMTWRPAPSSGSRRSSAGFIPSSGSCLRWNSFRSRKSAGSSSRSADGCWRSLPSGPSLAGHRAGADSYRNQYLRRGAARQRISSGCGDILAETGLAARFLELELTETFLMQDSTSTSEVLQRPQGAGLYSWRSMTSAPAIRA